jgi:hypothetical protein
VQLRIDVERSVVLSSTVLFFFHKELGTLLLANKLPDICEWREMADAACLASYGTTIRELYAMQAALIEKILKGTHPADTPAQQPTKFEFVINLRVAREIGIQIPPAILARADEVIEYRLSTLVSRLALEPGVAGSGQILPLNSGRWRGWLRNPKLDLNRQRRRELAGDSQITKWIFPGRAAFSANSTRIP